MRRLALSLLACGGILWQFSPAQTATPDVTFTKDVASILHAKCVNCHRAGEVAPMALLTYQDARPYARAIKDKVASRQMPPWFADPAFGAFVNDARLSDKEIATLTSWVDAGAPQGDAKDMPAPTMYPDGMGRWVRKGQTLRTNLHYHPNGTPQIDRTKVGLYFGKGDLKKEVVASLAGNIAFQIPPQTQNYELRAAYVTDQDVNIVSLFPHMHLRGKDMTMTATYPGGRRTETLLNVPAYDFNWQLFYYPRNDIRLPKGTRIDLVAHYDNSSANKRNPDPNRRVTFGEASTAEMMFGMFEFTAADGISPAPSTPRDRMQALQSSFADSAYLVDLVRPRQTIPSVLHIPASGDGAWYVPTFGMIFVSPIKPVWTGKTFEFEGVLHVGAGPGDPPFTVRGERLDDGSIKASVTPIDDRPIPFAEFTGRK